jgi:hypothetical protein
LKRKLVQPRDLISGPAFTPVSNVRLSGLQHKEAQPQCCRGVGDALQKYQYSATEAKNLEMIREWSGIKNVYHGYHSAFANMRVQGDLTLKDTE